MPYSAVDALEDAYRATKGLLWPFKWRRWLALAVVFFFASGAAGFDPGANVGVVDLPTPPAGPGLEPGPGTGFVFDPLVVVALVAGAVVLAAVFAIVGAVMEFVFVRAVVTREVRLREDARTNVGKGLSLFGFRLLIGLLALAAVLFLAALVLGTGLVGLVVVALLSPVLAAGFVSLYLLHRFTVDFIVPVMLVEDVGVVAGWRRFGAELRAETTEDAVYALVRLAFGVAASLVVGVGFVLVALVVGVPFAAVWAVLALLGAPASQPPPCWRSPPPPMSSSSAPWASSRSRRLSRRTSDTSRCSFSATSHPGSTCWRRSGSRSTWPTETGTDPVQGGTSDGGGTGGAGSPDAPGDGEDVEEWPPSGARRR